MELTADRTYDHSDGSTERWWITRHHQCRGVDIATTVKTLQRCDGQLTDQGVTLRLGDHATGTTITIPVAILDQVIDVLQTATADVAQVWEHITT